MNNQTDISLKFSNDITNIEKLEKYAKSLGNIKDFLKELDSKQIKELDNSVGSVAALASSQKDAKKTSNALKTALSVSKMTAFTVATEKLIKSFSKMSEQSAAYLENMNLLDVAYNNNTTSADRLVNRMAEMYGLDESWGYRTVGMFKQLANAMDITGETGTKMANVLSLLAVDLSSLYNVSTTKSVEKLESALAGQTKPIRSYGADITEMTLQQTLLNNSINMTVDKLSFAEKRLLIVSAILQQTKEANNDWARTIESLANQMRIFDEQVSRLTRSLGNIFLPILKNILPYVNAFLMVLVEITSWLAALVGYNPKEFDFFGEADANIMDVSSSVGDLGDSLDNASSSAKKLKQGLRGFDKLNNITTPTTGGGASGGGASGGGVGIDPKILDLFNKTTDDYLSKLTDVQMKATRIRDSIMEWLGFTKKVDSITGKVSFKLKEGLTRFKIIKELIKGIISYKIAKKIANLVKDSTLLKGIIVKIFDKIGKTNTLKNLNKNIGLIAISVGGLISSLSLAKSTGKDFANETVPLSDKISELGLSMLGAASSGATLGLQLGGIKGAILGGVIGAVGSLVTAWSEWVDVTNEKQVNEEVLDGLGVKLEQITRYYSNLFNETTKAYEPLEKLRQKYYESKEAVNSIEEEIANFEAALDNQNTAITQSQLDELKSKYERLKIANHEATQASLDYRSAIVRAYEEQSEAGRKSAAEQIAAMTELELKQQGYQDEYIKKMGELKEEYFKNKIGVEEYNKKVNELNETYGIANSTLDIAMGSASGFAAKIKDIDYTSPKKAAESIKEIDEAFRQTSKSIDENKKSTASFYDESIKKYETQLNTFRDSNGNIRKDLNETQKEIVKTAQEQLQMAINQKTEAMGEFERTSEELSGNYKGFLATIYADLTSQGADTSKEWSGVYSTIKSSLENLKDIKITGVGKKMLTNITDEIQKNQPQTMQKINVTFNKFGIDAGESWKKAIINQMTKDMSYITNSSKKVGDSSAQGYINGINKKSVDIQKAGRNIAKWSIDSTKSGLDSHSPSKVYIGIGSDTIQGFINGISSKKTTLLKEISTLLNQIQKKFNDTKLKINISTNVENSYNSILSKTQTFVNRFRNAINQMLSSMSTSMNGIKVIDNKITYTSMPYINIPRFKQGIDYVPKDYYLSYLDEGERVLTKQENQEYTRNKMSSTQKQISQTIIVQVGSKEVAKVVLDDLQDKARDLGKPITITG